MRSVISSAATLMPRTSPLGSFSGCGSVIHTRSVFEPSGRWPLIWVIIRWPERQSFPRSVPPAGRLGNCCANRSSNMVSVSDAERVFHLKDGELAVWPVGFHEEFAVLAKEARFHPVIVESCTGKITQYRFIGCSTGQSCRVHAGTLCRQEHVQSAVNDWRVAGEDCAIRCSNTWSNSPIDDCRRYRSPGIADRRTRWPALVPSLPKRRHQARRYPALD